MKKMYFIHAPENAGPYDPEPEINSIVSVYPSEKFSGFFRIKGFETNTLGQRLHFHNTCFAEIDQIENEVVAELAAQAMERSIERIEKVQRIFTTSAEF